MKILPKRSLKIRPGRVTMVIGRPVEVSGYTIETRGELIETDPRASSSGTLRAAESPAKVACVTGPREGTP